MSVLSSFSSSFSNTNIPQAIKPTVMNSSSNEHLPPFSIFKHPATSASDSTASSGSNGESTSPVNHIPGPASKSNATKRTSHSRTQRELIGTLLNNYIDKVTEEEKIKTIKAIGNFFLGAL